MGQRASQFSVAYADFVAELGRRCDSLAWWSTWLASKNRFLSPITPPLEAFWQSGKKPKLSRPRYFFLIVRNLLRLLKFIIWILPLWRQTRLRLGSRIQEWQRQSLPQRSVLIKTFAYRHSFEEAGFRDVFFGEVPSFLAKDGAAVFTIFDPLGCWKEAWSFCERHNRYLPYLALVEARDFFWALAQLLKESFTRCIGPISFREEELMCFTSRWYRVELLDPGAFHALLFHRAFERIAAIGPWKDFLLTLENNPWERMCISAFRKKSPATRILGYQHTIVSEASLNMFPGKGELEFAPRPNVLLTVGKDPAEILRENGAYPERFRIEPSCAVRFAYLDRFLRPAQAPITPPAPKKSLLIAFEAAPETYRLLDFLVRNREALAGWEVRARAHPAMPYAEIEGRLKEKPSRLPDFSVSSGASLAEDLARAGAVIYWGSTVSLEALAQGIPVIHLDMGHLLSYDPLYRCAHYKWTARETEPLGPVLESILTLSPEKRQEQYQSALRYLGDYFWPVTLENLQKFSKE